VPAASNTKREEVPEEFMTKGLCYNLFMQQKIKEQESRYFIKLFFVRKQG